MINRTGITISEKKNKTGPGDQFRKLLKKISSLEKEARLQREELDNLISSYLKEIQPIVERRRELVDQWIQSLMPFYFSTQLKERDKGLFAEIITAQLKTYTQLNDGHLPDHLAEFFKVLEGQTFEEAKNEEFKNTLQEMEGHFAELGIDLDLSGIDANTPEEEVSKILAKKLDSIFEEKGTSDSKPRKKTRRQEEKERKEKLSEEIKKKNLNSIYRELAKAIHPDLEQDPGLKKVKEEVMKELTAAYEKQDLRTLFRLEMEWLQREESELDKKPEELLKVYIQMLKDQIEDLKMEIEMEDSHPKYDVLRKFFNPEFSLREINIKEWTEIENAMLLEYRTNVETVKNCRPPVLPKIIRDLLSEFRRFKSWEPLW